MSPFCVCHTESQTRSEQRKVSQPFFETQVKGQGLSQVMSLPDNDAAMERHSQRGMYCISQNLSSPSPCMICLILNPGLALHIPLCSPRSPFLTPKTTPRPQKCNFNIHFYQCAFQSSYHSNAMRRNRTLSELFRIQAQGTVSYQVYAVRFFLTWEFKKQ